MAAATVRAGLTAEGSLYESCARGNKDAFFFSDNRATALDPFENRYEPVPPVVHELRRIPPTNAAEFGRSCEFDFEIAGDMFLKPTVLIDLPTWLPAAEAALNTTESIRATADPNLAYGYTNGIAYFLFSKIQIFQDKLLLNEFSGDTLWASRATRGSLNSGWLENRLAGWHDGSADSIAAAATPGRLRLELPFIGGAQRGFPSIAMRQNNFKLKLFLRPLEEVIESSGPPTTSPKPWAVPSYTVTFAGGSPAPRTFAPLARTAIPAPQLQLETRHMYTDGESQLALRSTTLEIPFQQLYENVFTYGPYEYAPFDRMAATAAVTKRVDARHPASRLFWFIRSQNDLRAGRRWKVVADISGAEYYMNQSLIIAGRDRETLFPALVWGDLTTHAKEERDPGPGLSEMNWELGAIPGARGPFAERQPEGAVNFSQADRPTLYTELANVPADTQLGKPSTEMLAVVDSWAFYTIEKDRGTLKYGN